jgi:hypothetical protein
MKNKQFYFHSISPGANDMKWCEDVRKSLEQLQGIIKPYFNKHVDIVIHNQPPVSGRGVSLSAWRERNHFFNQARNLGCEVYNIDGKQYFCVEQMVNDNN